MRNMISRWFRWLLHFRWLVTFRLIAAQQEARKRLLSEPRYQNPKRLNRHEFQVYSQNGEDGILAEIFRRVGIVHHTFLEIGVGDGLETNTTYLLLQGWKGYWVEANRRHVTFIRRHFSSVIETGVLMVKQAFVTAENVADVIASLGVPVEIDLLSLDVDRNTWYVLRALLHVYQPRVLVVEYNSLFPPPVNWKVEYAPEKVWGRSSYFGASLKAYEILCGEFNYALVGCDLCGVNAFFVRSDLALPEKFLPPFTAENHYEPLRDYLMCRVGPPRQFTDLTD